MRTPPRGWSVATELLLLDVMDMGEYSLQLHKKFGGKITTVLRDPGPLDAEHLSAYYSPGVAAASTAIHRDPALLRDYTWVRNLVAVVTDGTAVLGLGDVGPRAAMPVMEGKAMLFKHFAGIDCVPITLDVHSADEIVAAVKAIAPSFGAINLEDIAAPTCFEVEHRLRRDLNIPVFHDDQHGTAVVCLAGLINATAVTGRKLSECRVVLLGAGAAGVSIADLIHAYAQPEIIACDSKGVISPARMVLTEEKARLATYHHSDATTMREALRGADIVIGISHAGLLTREDIATMAPQAIVFALANPDPEIMPEEALVGGAAIVATGRSDYPNQVNNAVAFPGIFRGALDNGITNITDDHLIAAAEALAAAVAHPTPQAIIPSVFDKHVVPAVAAAIR